MSRRSPASGGGSERNLIDELHLAIVPVLLGDGEHLLGGLNLPALGYECMERIEGARATHVILNHRKVP